MRTLVTGGAGFIGSHLVDRLVAENHEVVVLDNLFRGNLENIGRHLDSGAASFVETDIRDDLEMRKACDGCDAIFHLAAQSNVLGAVDDITYSFETNVIGTFNALKSAREAGVRRFIFTSSREAYGEANYLPVDEAHPLNAKNAYGASKVAGEKYCQVFQNSGDLEVVMFRLGNVYGERDFDRVIPIFLNNLAAGEPIRIYGGKQVIDFVSVELVVDALYQALGTATQMDGPTNVGAGRGTTLFELAERMKSLVAKESVVEIEPAREAEVVRFTADIARLREWFAREVPSDPLYYLEETIRRGWPELLESAEPAA